MTICKITSVAILLAAFALGSCSKDDDEKEENNKNVENEHEYVDLGLPSGTLWATCNVGASKPEEYGFYFAWGETEPKETYWWLSYKLCEGSPETMTKYCGNSDFGVVDNKTELDPEDDAATANWGSDWCMPTNEQQRELTDTSYTIQEWTIKNGIQGTEIISKKNGNSIFLPAAGLHIYGELEEASSAGYYWSRSLFSFVPDCARMLELHSVSCHALNFDNRQNGYSVRPVRCK